MWWGRGVVAHLLEPGVPLLPAYPHLDRLVDESCGDYHAVELSEGLEDGLDRWERLAWRWWWHVG